MSITLSTGELSRFSQCGHKYLLASQGVPLPPSTRQAVSRAVRRLIQDALFRPSEAPQSIAGVVAGEMATVALTEAESARGWKTTSDRVEYSVTRLFHLWNSVVKPRIKPTHLGRKFELGIAGATITGTIEIQEAGGIRATKIRTKRPTENEAERDTGLILQCIAAQAETVTVDYLIESEKLAVDRQTFSLADHHVESTRERVKAAVGAIEAGVFLPAEADSWKCLSCPLRMVCRFVS